MNKVQFLKHKHIYLKIIFSALFFLSIALVILAVLKTPPTLIFILEIILLILSTILFTLSMFSRTIKYTVGDRTFYVCIGIFSHYLTSRRHVLDHTMTYWFGTHSMYFEFDKLEVEAKLGCFHNPTLTANNEIVAKAK